MIPYFFFYHLVLGSRKMVELSSAARVTDSIDIFFDATELYLLAIIINLFFIPQKSLLTFCINV